MRRLKNILALLQEVMGVSRDEAWAILWTNHPEIVRFWLKNRHVVSRKARRSHL